MDEKDCVDDKKCRIEDRWGYRGRWGDRSLLKPLDNPGTLPYESTTKCPEITFFGDDEQPDFGTVVVCIVARKKVIELKSLKRYFLSFRNKRLSYERFVEEVYWDLVGIYDPLDLKISATFRPRGGMSTSVEYPRPSPVLNTPSFSVTVV